MNVKQRIQVLSKEMGCSLPKIEAELGFGNGTISRWSKSDPSYEKLKKVADFLNTTTDYLMTGEGNRWAPTLSNKNERDISMMLKKTLEELELNQEALAFDGEPLDEETKELLIASLERTIRQAKLSSKEKFTPNKYRD